MDIVNFSINNKKDRKLYERDKVQEQVLNGTKWIEGNEKALSVTLWSGRGSGKTSLLRQIALESDELKPQRDNGRIIIEDCKILVGIIDELRNDHDAMERVIPVLVVFHLCKLFGGSTVNGIYFSKMPQFQKLWSGGEGLSSSLREYLEMNSVAAYDLWKNCTVSVFGNSCTDVRPIILLDSAEELCVPNNTPQSPSYEERNDGVPQNLPRLHGDNTSEVEEKDQAKYILLEWLMMKVPSGHALIAFGTGATRNFPRPKTYQAHVIHSPIQPLQALSEISVRELFSQYRQKRESELSKKDEREIRLILAVTAGVPRMVVTAFSQSGSQLPSTKIETWQKMVASFYKETSDLTKTPRSTQCLAKAILVCAVCDIALVNESEDSGQTWDCATIPGETMKWEELLWDSVLFMSGPQGYLRIPRLLWSSNSTTHTRLQAWVKTNCKFELDDLMPTPKQLYEAAGSAAATSSGKAWEKMFASILVARFFVCCWKADEDPASHFISLKQLVPQHEENVDSILDTVEVCLSNGIVAGATEVLADPSLVEKDFQWNAIHGNWNIHNAHHDLILPVRQKGSEQSQQLWAISARNGHHKTASDLEKTQQLLVRKERDADGYVAEVDVLIQAVNPRLKSIQCRMTGKFRKMMDQKRYAEVSIKEGHCHHVLGCFD